MTMKNSRDLVDLLNVTITCLVNHFKEWTEYFGVV